MELRSTDVDEAKCRQRYAVFKEHYGTLLRLKQYFPFSLIDGAAPDARPQPTWLSPLRSRCPSRKISYLAEKARVEELETVEFRRPRVSVAHLITGASAGASGLLCPWLVQPSFSKPQTHIMEPPDCRTLGVKPVSESWLSAGL